MAAAGAQGHAGPAGAGEDVPHDGVLTVPHGRQVERTVDLEDAVEVGESARSDLVADGYTDRRGADRD